MGIITKYKLFERGDGVEDDDSPMPREMYLDSEGKWSLKQIFPEDYILGIPSGEVIMIDDVNVFKKIIDRRMASYAYSFRGKVLNCYVCPDKNVDSIKEYIDDQKDEDIDEETLNICREFRNEMSKVLKKKHVVAYVKTPLRDVFYLIVPDLRINSKYYKSKKHETDDVLASMMLKYSGKFFQMADRVVNEKVKYYGIPSSHSETNETPKGVCEEIRDKVMEITCQKYGVEMDEGYYYFNIPQRIINFFDKQGSDKIENILKEYRRKYPNMTMDWLKNFEESKHKWESGIFVKKN